MSTALYPLYTFTGVIEMAEKKKRRERWDTKVISGRISVPMMDAVLEIINTGDYANVTDYLRELIRNDLRARKANP